MIRFDCPDCGRQWNISASSTRRHCRCGARLIEVATGKPAPPAKPKPAGVGTLLRQRLGCGCKLPWREWDTHGIQWCRDHQSQIVDAIYTVLAANEDAYFVPSAAGRLVRVAIRDAAAASAA